jgi:succinyl-diaminopimelate desuccinylase
MSKINFDTVALTQALVKCPSVTPDDEGALQVIEDHLNAIEFKCTRLLFSENNTYDVNNLFATIGSSGKHLAFAGHTDVVPPGNTTSWMYSPFSATIENEKLYGRGAEDMKGGIACFVSATNSFLKKYGNDFGGKISFIITGDEEKEAINGTLKVMEWTKEKKIQFDHCIVGEPTSDKIVGDKIKIGRRGSINFFITVKGIQGHTANSHRAENPAHHLISLLHRIINNPIDKGNENFLPSSIQIPTIDINNSAANVIPEIAKATINIRFNNIHTGVSLKQWLKDHISLQFNDVINASCTFTSDQTGECFLTKPGDLSALVSSACREINEENINPKFATDGGTSDARFIKNYCEVLEIGLINKTLHQVNEFVKIEDLNKLHDLYLRILEKYFNKF